MAKLYGEIGYLKKQLRLVISADVDTVKDVVDYEKAGFKGFPAVTITCTGNENVFYSSVENQRTFVFMVRVYEQLENVPKLDSVSDNAKKRAEEIMERVVDQMINAFDSTTRFTLTDSADNGVEAVPSTWGYARLPAGWCRVAEILVRVKRTIKLISDASGGITPIQHDIA